MQFGSKSSQHDKEKTQRFLRMQSLAPLALYPFVKIDAINQARNLKETTGSLSLIGSLHASGQQKRE